MTTPTIDPSGTLTVNGTSGSGGPVTTLGQYWIAAPNAAGTNALAATGFLGTSSNNHMDLVSNNIVRGRLSNIGEFFIGTTNTVLTGDLMNGVGNNTFPWAVNGYSAFNGSGVYGSVTSGATIYAGVQGEYFGTNAEGAGVRGVIGNTTAGTGFGAVSAGVSGLGALNNSTAGSYKFGVYGDGGYTVRSGGVMGYDFGYAQGALGYYAANGFDYCVYGFGQAYTTGVATGYYPNLNENLLASNDNNFNLKYLDNRSNGDEIDFNSWSSNQPNKTIGLGIYGGVMGGWIKGLVYGTNLSGAKYGLYVHGKTITNNVYYRETFFFRFSGKVFLIYFV